MNPEETTRIGVRTAAQQLTNQELAAQNNVMQVDWDPRNVLGYEKISHLYTEKRGEIPVAHALVKDEFAQIALERLK